MSDKQIILILRKALREANQNIIIASLGAALISFAIGYFLGDNQLLNLIW